MAINTTSDMQVPTATGFGAALEVAVGQSAICAVYPTQILCAGANWYGQLGTGSLADSHSPQLNGMVCAPN